MWITKLQLSNIKSYGKHSPAIEFRPGVNLIQGRNGAGKSTMLEAIGLALFGSRTYTHEQFVREGARHGEIVVGFVSGIDDREYEVVRGVGVGARAYIYDPALGQKISEGAEDTAAFIRQHLRVEMETDLAALFRDAVGVPQGTMTAIFLAPASTRRETFNRLLRIDEYERVWQSLRETDRYIRDRMVDNERRQAQLQGSLSDLPALAAEIKTLTRRVKAGRTELRQIKGQLAGLAAQLGVLDGLKQQLDEFDRQIGDFQSEVKRLEDRLILAEAAVRDAQAAARVVGETEAGYRAYERAQEQLEKLEAARSERDRLLAERNRFHTALELCRQDLQRVSEELQTVEQAEAEMERLTPLVEEQEALEESLGRATQDLAESERLQGQVAQYGDVLDGLTGRLEEVTACLDEAGLRIEPERPVDQPAAGSLEAQVDTARDLISWLESTLERLVDAREAFERAREEVESLQNQLERRDRLQQRLDALTQEWQAVAERENEVRLRLSQIALEQQKLDEYQGHLREADARCPVCRRPMDDHARANSKAHLAAERVRLEAARQSAQARLQAALSDAEKLDGARRELGAQIEALPGPASLTPAQARLRDTAAVLDDRRVELARLLGASQNGCDVLAALLGEAAAYAEKLAASSRTIAEWQARLTELGDPRRDYARSADLAGQRTAVESRLAGQEAQCDDLQGQLDRIDTDLNQYADLNDRFSESRQVRDDNREAHQLFLTRKDTAAELEDRRAALGALQSELEARRTAQAQTQQARDTLASGYDAGAHEQLRARFGEMTLRQVEVQTRLEDHEETLQARRQKMADLEQAQQQLAQCEQERARLETRYEAFEFVRSGIRQAGPQITEQLVRLIAEQANRIFADVLGDPALVLNWSEDYAISVTYRGETRDFTLLSGGEQMVAAMAIRLALLTQLANVRFAFFDEPTANLDEVRRQQLAESLGRIRSLEQLFVISHDDTFEQESYHVVQVRKENDLSQVETL